MEILATAQQRQHVDKLLCRIAAAWEAGKVRKAEHLIRQYLNSFDAKCRAVEEAYRAIRPDRRPDKSTLALIAKNLDPWKGTKEEAIVHLKPKASDPSTYRPFMDFGIENRALQYLIKNVLEHIVQLHPRQYFTRGGPQVAIKQAASALSEGSVWAVEVDIKDCFKSFDGTKLTSVIPLPKEVSDHVLISLYLYMKGGNISNHFGPVGAEWSWKFLFDDVLADARQGIPQGSAVSPLVAEAVLAVSLHKLPQVGEIVAYADNILLMAKTKDDVVSMTLALWSALEAHPVGRLRPKLKKFDAGEPIEFLGHRLTRKSGGGVDIEPKQANLDEFKNELGNGLQRLIKKDRPWLQRVQEAARLRAYVRGWCAAFKLWPGVVDLRKRSFKQIGLYRDFWL